MPDKTVHELHAQAAARALADSGLRRDEIDGLFSCGGTDALHILQLAEYLGLQPRFLDSTLVVDLEEGVRVIANWDRVVPLDRLSCGAPVRSVFEKITEEISLPRVRPLATYV